MDDQPIIEMEFRDGKRVVPAHLAAALDTIETYRLTYREAVRMANDEMVREVVTTKVNKVIEGHFRRFR